MTQPLTGALMVTNENIDMSPWCTLRKRYAQTIGLTPHVQVSELIALEGCYRIQFNVDGCEQAKALRQLLQEEVQFPQIKVMLQVMDTVTGNEVMKESIIYRSEEELAKVCSIALRNNPLIRGVLLTAGKVGACTQKIVGHVVLVIEKEIIQFPNGNIEDLFNRYSTIAAAEFRSLLINYYVPHIRLGFVTDDSKFLETDDMVYVFEKEQTSMNEYRCPCDVGQVHQPVSCKRYRCVCERVYPNK